MATEPDISLKDQSVQRIAYVQFTKFVRSIADADFANFPEHKQNFLTFVRDVCIDLRFYPQEMGYDFDGEFWHDPNGYRLRIFIGNEINYSVYVDGKKSYSYSKTFDTPLYHIIERCDVLPHKVGHGETFAEAVQNFH